jgi:hypothetical protein
MVTSGPDQLPQLIEVDYGAEPIVQTVKKTCKSYHAYHTRLHALGTLSEGEC